MGGGAVYSTREGRLCPECGRPAVGCVCKRVAAAAAAARGDGVVRVGRVTAGRKGKGVTTVTGLPLADDALAALAGELKRACGSGGTVKDGIVEIQGEHRDRLVGELEKRGYRVKRVGG